MNKAIYILLAAGFFIMLGTSCSKYEKLLKSNDHDAKYKAAIDYYNRGKYGRSTPLFDAVVLANRNTPRDDSTNFYLAKSYYLDGDPYTAEYYFEIFKNTFPRSPFAEEAAFLRGICLYEASFRPDLDQGPTYKALSAFAEYLYTYPNTTRKEEIKTFTDELTNRLEKKAFQAGRFYYHIEDYVAAITTLKNNLIEFPDSEYREEAFYLILRSNYLYAHNSVRAKQKERYQKTIDEYYNFISEFPQSSYVKEARSMYERSISAIGGSQQSQSEEVKE